MRPLRVVVGDELAQNRVQVLLIQDDDVIEALAPHGADDSLGDGVRARGPDRREQGRGPERPGACGKVRAVGAVTVPDKLAGGPAPRRRLDELTPDPGGGRVRGDVDMDQLTPVVGDEHQNVEGSKRQGGHGEQVGGPDLGPVVGEEGTPRLARWADGPMPAMAANRAIADRSAELEEFAPDPFGAPDGILARHGRNELPNLRSEPWPTTTRARLPAPEQAPALTVPADDGVRSNEHQMVAPLGTEPPSEDPEQLVSRPQLGTRTRAEGHGQLVMEEYVLDHEALAVAKEANQDVEPEPKEFKHEDRIQDRKSGS